MKWLLIILMISFASLSTQAQNKVISQSAKNDQILIDPVSPSPSFPGGQKAWHKFLFKNLRWPNTPIDAEGRVIISFFVEKDGRLTNFKVERSLRKEFDAEALRVLKKSPKWIPGMQNGRPVRVRYSVPINFILSE